MLSGNRRRSSKNNITFNDDDPTSNNPPSSKTQALMDGFAIQRQEEQEELASIPRRPPPPQDLPFTDITRQMSISKKKGSGGNYSWINDNKNYINRKKGFQAPSPHQHTTILRREPGFATPRRKQSNSEIVIPGPGPKPPSNIMLFNRNQSGSESSVTQASVVSDLTTPTCFVPTNEIAPPLLVSRPSSFLEDEDVLPPWISSNNKDEVHNCKAANNHGANEDKDNLLFETRRSLRTYRRSSSFTDFEKLQEFQKVLEVFPKVNRNRVREVLRESSFRTAMNILAEESIPLDTIDIKNVDDNIAAVVRKPSPVEAAAVVNGDADVIDNQYRNTNYAQRRYKDDLIERIPTTLWKSNKIHESLYPDLSHSQEDNNDDNGDDNVIIQETNSSSSFKFKKTRSCLLSDDDDEEGRKPYFAAVAAMATLTRNQSGFCQMRPALSYLSNRHDYNTNNAPMPTTTKRVRSNSFTSISTYEKDHVDLEQIQEIFPNVETIRANYLLRQHSLGTVMMLLASENSQTDFCEI